MNSGQLFLYEPTTNFIFISITHNLPFQPNRGKSDKSRPPHLFIEILLSTTTSPFIKVSICLRIIFSLSQGLFSFLWMTLLEH